MERGGSAGRPDLSKAWRLLTLHIEHIKAPQYNTDSRRGPHDDEDDGAQSTEREKGREVVCVKATEAADCEPLETNTEACPKSMRVA